MSATKPKDGAPGKIRTFVVGVEDRLPSTGQGIIYGVYPIFTRATTASESNPRLGTLERKSGVEPDSDFVGNDISHHVHPHKKVPGPQ